MRQILLIRHGATAGNLQRRYIGRTDEPLCAQGEAQARLLGQQGLRPNRVLVSPALRARQTARLAFPQIGAQVVAGLMETDFGVFEGKSAAQLKDDPAYRAWVDTGCTGPIPGGESVAAFKARCCRAFAAAAEELPEGSCGAFVTHGGVIMAVLEAYARPRREFYTYHVGNGEVVRCVWEDGLLRLI